MLDNYRHYFDIDPEYYSQVNQAIIDSRPYIWKKFYPHETFVKLIKDTISVLSRRQKLSIWVEGAYGTGKSHAVLTLKKLLDAPEEDTRIYFEKYPDQLNNDLCNQLQQLKSDNRKLITVHRYGSSNIYGDNSLVFALQESIERALSENGIKSTGKSALKDAAIKWLSDMANKDYFNTLIADEYKALFGGDDVDAIIEKLRTYTGDALITLMNKISKVADERQFKALTLDVSSLVEWIKSVIKENDLKAIVFIWDEFTNYFENNLKALTGFQQIVEISATEPFYLIIVTHKSAGLFNDTDKDQKRILDRFVKPTCNITLPENMAFRLMGAAMVKTDDPVILSDWEETADELYDRTKDSRKLVKQKANISDSELKDILPIHPYAALVLKHISSAFDSNQRSMFDFIKNDRGGDIKGFQWFIDNCSPEDANPLLTVDILWDFFYEKGKEYLSTDIRSILDCYSRATTRKLDEDEQRVLKTTLLLQAISQHVGDTVELFIPNDKNINNAFEGSDLNIGAAGRIAEKLVRDEILYRKPLGGNKYQFSALINAGDLTAIEKLKEDIYKRTTSALIEEGAIHEAISLGGALKLRYVLRYVSAGDFNPTIKQLRNQESSMTGKIVAVVAFAKDDNESATISKLIKDALADGSYHMIFIDASVTPLGKDTLEQYVEAMANAQYHRGKDNALSLQYEMNAKDALKKWKNRISNGEFIISYTADEGQPITERMTSVDHLCTALAEVNKKQFEYSLETGAPVIDNMWVANSLKSGVEYGASQITQGSFRSSNPQTKLENYLKVAWNRAEEFPPYWVEKPYELISKIKLQVMQTAERSFKSEGRVSIAAIYDELKEKPFGFLPCNLTAFIMGFVLKEYIDGTYSWSDGLTTDILNVTKLKEMVAEVIQLQITANPRYRDKFIVILTQEEKAFNEASSQIFNIPLNQCANIEQTRERIRNEMKKLSFPVWCLKYILEGTPGLKTDPKIIEELIDCYSGIANSQNFGSAKSDSDIAMVIGTLCLKYANLVEDMRSMLTEKKCTEGMLTYLQDFEGGDLVALANSIGDNGQYINVLKSKFDADAANWVWNLETAQKKIKEVILEYRIIVESNKVLSKTVSFEGAISEWCDKCNYIRISYPAAKNHLDDVGEFLEMLYEIKKSGTLLDSQKQQYLTLLTTHMNAFTNFYNNQVDVFVQVCEYYTEGFTLEEINDLYMTLPTGCFIREKADYLSLVETRADEFRNQLSATKLKKLWKDKTRTVSPRVWSKEYKMPILCMIEDENIQAAKLAFGAINQTKPDARAIDRAIDFLENANFFDKLESSEERDKAFRNVILKNYAVMLTDVDEAKNYLDRTIAVDPYDWFGLPEVEKKLRQMAEAKYNQGGVDKALERIDSMDIADVKRYLKDLIKDNMTVGIEIIKEK